MPIFTKFPDKRLHEKVESLALSRLRPFYGIQME